MDALSPDALADLQVRCARLAPAVKVNLAERRRQRAEQVAALVPPVEPEPQASAPADRLRDHLRGVTASCHCACRPHWPLVASLNRSELVAHQLEEDKGRVFSTAVYSIAARVEERHVAGGPLAQPVIERFLKTNTTKEMGSAFKQAVNQMPGPDENWKFPDKTEYPLFCGALCHNAMSISWRSTTGLQSVVLNIALARFVYHNFVSPGPLRNLLQRCRETVQHLCLSD
jgi:hypothetical protein